MPSNEENRRVFGRRFRTTLCNSFLATGHCKYHNRCMYAHGADLLRTEEQNVADGLNCESAIRAWAKAHRPAGHMSATPLPPPLSTSPFPLPAASVASDDWAAGSPLNMSVIPSCYVNRPMSDSIDDTLSDRDIESPQSGFLMGPNPNGHHHILEIYALTDKLLSLAAEAQTKKAMTPQLRQPPTWWRHDPYSLVAPVVSATAPSGR